jgi:RNA polymerase sigma factor
VIVDLEQMILEVKKGDTDENKREELLRNLEPYACRMASRICQRMITRQDDEYIITLHAINEAIDRFEPNQSRSFLSFAYLVASTRIVDYYRQEKKHVSPFSLDQSDSQQSNYLGQELYQLAAGEFLEKELQEMRKEEILRYQSVLAKYRVKFSDLPLLRPKHRDSRKTLIRFAQKIALFPEIYKRLLENKKTPREWLKKIGIHHRTLQRHRQYLIALAVLFSEDLPLLQNFLAISLEREEG